MQLINTNRVKSAKFQLSQHRVQGERSSLSILQVAHLMDVVKNEGVTKNQKFRNRSELVYIIQN